MRNPDLQKYIIPTDFDDYELSYESKPNQITFSEEYASNPLFRAATSFTKQAMTIGDTAKNLGLILNNAINAGNPVQRKKAENEIRSSIKSSDQFYVRPSENLGETAGDVAGGVLGGALQAYAMGVPSGSTPIGDKILSKAGNGIIGKAASSAVDNALLGIPLSAMQAVSESESAKDAAANFAKNIGFDLAAGGIMGGVSGALGKLKRANGTDDMADSISSAKKNAAGGKPALVSSEGDADISTKSALKISETAPEPETKFQSVDNSINDAIESVGEKRAFNAAYEADNPIPGGVATGLDGTKYTTREYADAFDNLIPETEKELEYLVDELKLKSQKTPSLEINIQLFAAERKLARIKLQNGENGNTVRGFIKSRMKGQDPTSSKELMDTLSKRTETYTPKSNKTLLEESRQAFSGEDEQVKLYNRLMKMDASDMFSDAEFAAAQEMAAKEANAGNVDRAADIMQGISRKGTEGGRAVQSLSITQRLSPEGVLLDAQRKLKDAAEELSYSGIDDDIVSLAKKITERVQGADGVLSEPDILKIIEDQVNEIPSSGKRLQSKINKTAGAKKALAERILEAVDNGGINAVETRRFLYDELKLPTLDTETANRLVELVEQAKSAGDYTKEQAEIFQEVYELLGSKIPMNGWEKFESWRKFSMLANPKTHLKNTLSNVAMMPLRKSDDALSQAIEWFLPQSERTRALGWSFTDHGQSIKGVVDEATERAVLEMGNLGKYDLSDSAILKARKTFKDKGVGKLFNKASSLNSRMLEKEDEIFFKPAFRDNLGQIMTARGMDTVTPEVYDMAMNRALEATFRVNNKLNQYIQKIKKSDSKVAKAVADVIIPFAKTPANLLERAFDYSPIGLGHAGADLVSKLRGTSGKASADIVHEFAKGITGSALLALGLYLGNAGIINTEYRTGEKQRAADELTGEQQNSIRIGDSTVAIDWLQPVAFPLIAGASIGQAVSEEDADKTFTQSASDVMDSVSNGFNSIFELSMLQSLFDLFGGDASDALNSVVENAASQVVPTAIGQIARTADPIQRKTAGNNTLETMANRAKAKIPAATTTLEPELDIWGNVVNRGNQSSSAMNAFNQFINPASTKTSLYSDDPVTQMVLGIYESTDDSKALPSAPDKSGDNPLTVEEYTYYAQLIGAAQREAAEEIYTNNPVFRIQRTREGSDGEERKYYVNRRFDDMTDKEKAKALGRVFSDAKQEAEDYIEKMLKGAISQ